MSPEPVVELRSVHKAFRKKQVLRGVDLVVERGGVLGFVGPNGAGKSTCLRILIGLVPRDQGEARVLGLDPAVASLAIRRRCSYLPGETSLYQHMTGGEFLDFALGFYGRLQADLADRMRAEFDLPLDRRIRAYSAGMKQKLALMAAMIPDVDLYVLDEPDRALDATARLALRELIRGLHGRGKSILLSSHHLAEIEALTDKLAFLVDGRIVPDARVQSAREELRREVRLRLRRANVALPDGVSRRVDEPDGTVRVQTTGDPIDWLQQLDRGNTVAVEVGVTHLERLYQMLTVAEP
jgi:ABC-2 type transport system ATP-binding protein